MMIGAVILAAGYSRRFKVDKLVLEMTDGRTMLQVTIERLLELKLPVVVILRRNNRQRIALCERLGVSCFFVDEGAVSRELDMSASARCAAQVAVEQSWSGMMLCLADMPFIQLASFALMARQQQLARPCFEGRPGHPVFFPATLFEQFSSLSGDVGARAVISKNREQLLLLAVEDAGVLQDIDTQQQWQRLLLQQRDESVRSV